MDKTLAHIQATALIFQLIVLVVILVTGNSWWMLPMSLGLLVVVGTGWVRSKRGPKKGG